MTQRRRDAHVPGLRDKLRPEGRMELFVARGAPVLSLFDPLPSLPGFPLVHRGHALDFSKCQLLGTIDMKNILVNVGKDAVISSLTSGFVHPIVRMAMGDRGTIPSDSTVPKVPVATQTTLFNEVNRGDLDATVINVGTPTVHQAQFIKTFSAALIPIASFSNQAAPVINEVGLINANVLATPLPRAPVSAPAAPPADETLFAIRTFKSVPFEAADQITVTIRYTIYIE